MTIYKTNEWKGYGKQNYYWNEYRLEGGEIAKFKGHRYQLFDGRESNWNTDESFEESWSLEDPKLPNWLRNYV